MKRSLTYGQLDAAANQVANGLRGLGVRKGDKVVLGRDDGWLRFAVRDDGPGFAVVAGATLDSSGLQGMRDRLAALGVLPVLWL